MNSHGIAVRRIAVCAIAATAILVILAPAISPLINEREVALDIVERGGSVSTKSRVGPDTEQQIRSWSQFPLRVTSVLLHHEEVDPVFCRQLRWFPNLQVLYLCSANVGDEELHTVAELTKLETLHLNNSRVTEAGMVTLSKMPQLRCLQLNGTRVTDDSLSTLAKFPQLERLTLNSTLITDAGLQHLHAASSLQVLCIDDTPTTPAGIAELRLHLPKCQIRKWQPPATVSEKLP